MNINAGHIPMQRTHTGYLNVENVSAARTLPQTPIWQIHTTPQIKIKCFSNDQMSEHNCEQCKGYNKNYKKYTLSFKVSRRKANRTERKENAKGDQ